MSLSLNYPNLSPSLLLDFASTESLDPRITFTRASTATFYNGVTTAKAEENLLLNSQELGSFFLTRATVTANSTTAPDGTTTADSLLQQTGQTIFGNCAQTLSVNAGACSQSIFAKPNGKNFLIIQEALSDGTNRRTWFNVQNGTVGTTNANHTASIVASANGFFRCVITFTANAARTAQINFGVADSDNSTTVTDSGGLFLWGAQLEQRSAVTAYTVTTTQPITNYVPVLLTAQNNVARFEHNPITGESLGLEIEEQRTNLLTYSSEFNDASWSKSNTTVTANTVVAPDGTLTADSAIPNTTSATHTIQLASTVTATAHTLTVYAKPNGYNFITLQLNGGGGGAFAYYNLSTGAVGDTGNSPASTSITAVGNGWYRCSLTKTSTTTSMTSVIYTTNANSVTFFAGNGFSGVFLWGAQLEAGAFSTSYIPTAASQVTRSADNASMTGTNFSSWYNAAEGAVYVDGTGRTNGVFLNISDNSFNNRLPQMNIDGSNNLTANIIRNGSVVASMIPSGTHIFGTVAKLSMAYKTNDCVAVANSVPSATVTSVSLPSGLTQMDIGSFQNGGSKLNGTIKKLAFYPLRITNSQLQALTTV